MPVCQPFGAVFFILDPISAVSALIGATGPF
jgi:hypothetical protein